MTHSELFALRDLTAVYCKNQKSLLLARFPFMISWKSPGVPEQPVSWQTPSCVQKTFAKLLDLFIFFVFWNRLFKICWFCFVQR